MIKKFAYIIIANSISDVLLTSIKMIDSDLNDIFILFDKKAKLLEQADILRRVVKKSKLEICEQVVNWGGGTHKLMLLCIS